jgi:excinuclease ABC subunit C
MVSEKILSPEFLKTVSNGPGVYQMLGKKEVLYVGKAVNLRKRLASYRRHLHTDHSKTAVMLAKVKRIETILTTTEKEALILEASLIKKHRPRYNVILRDDKTYPLIKITVTDKWPRIIVTRKRSRDGSCYFGPYSSTSSMRETLKLLQSIFPLRRCPKVKTRNRPCLNFQLGQCLAPCCMPVDEKKYQELVNSVLMVLEGRNRELIAELKQNMKLAAKALEFEKAAVIRDQVNGLERTLERQVIVANHTRDQDVFGLVRRDASVGIAILFVRSGMISGAQSFFLADPLGSDNTILSKTILQYYSSFRQPPPEILLPDNPDDLQLLQERLTELREATVRITVPQRGRSMQLMKMAHQNSIQVFAEQSRKKKSWDTLSTAVQKSLALRNSPNRVECIDISNIGGKQAVGSLVSYERGVKNKKGYRHYTIKSKDEPDDYAMMREVLDRKLKRWMQENNAPDLLLLDGGKGQLNLAIHVLEKYSMENEIDLVAIAKEKQQEGEKLFRPGRKNPIVLPHHSPVLLFFMRVRDEAHRFAITHHRQLRRKKTLSSGLDSLQGVGEKRKKLLLKTFGSHKRLKQASQKQLQEVQGIGKQLADSIYNQLHINDET